MFTHLTRSLGTPVPLTRSQILSSSISEIRIGCDPVLYNRESYSQGSWSDLDAFDIRTRGVDTDTKVADGDTKVHSPTHSIGLEETAPDDIFAAVSEEVEPEITYTQTDPVSGCRPTITPLLMNIPSSTAASRSLPVSPSSAHVAHLSAIQHASAIFPTGTNRKSGEEATTKGCPIDTQPSSNLREQNKRTPVTHISDHSKSRAQSPSPPPRNIPESSRPNYTSSAEFVLEHETVDSTSAPSPPPAPVITGEPLMGTPKRRAALVAEQRLTDARGEDDAESSASDHIASRKTKRKQEDDYTVDTPLLKRRRTSTGDVPTHTQGRRSAHRCGQCSQTFTRLGDLDRHLKSAKGHPDAKEWPCLSCGKVYTRLDALQRHNKGPCSLAEGSSTSRRQKRRGGQRRTERG